MTACLCGRPAIWIEASFSGRPREPRALCNACAPDYAASDTGCTLRRVGVAPLVLHNGHHLMETAASPPFAARRGCLTCGVWLEPVRLLRDVR